MSSLLLLFAHFSAIHSRSLLNTHQPSLTYTRQEHGEEKHLQRLRRNALLESLSPRSRWQGFLPPNLHVPQGWPFDLHVPQGWPLDLHVPQGGPRVWLMGCFDRRCGDHMLLEAQVTEYHLLIHSFCLDFTSIFCSTVKSDKKHHLICSKKTKYNTLVHLLFLVGTRKAFQK